MIKTLPSLSPNQLTYRVLLSQSCKEFDSSSSYQKVLNLMVNNKFKPNKVIIDVAIRSLCFVGRVDYVVLLVKEFSLKHSKPNIFTYNFLVKSLCKSSILNSVYSFIDEMKNIFNIKPDTIMKGYCMLSKGIEAVRIYKQMKEEGVLPDLVMYNTLNFGLSKCGRVSEAMKFLKIIVELGRFANVVTYTSLMNGMCREEDVFSAMALLEVTELK
ncbi:hypothetical protein NC653_018886 [Populus alba x Populus x berolinensis]|uniref:Pentatricopeptide repeat-containing protein n=2 Tax=Populus TaxID=3689 RepID=A0AAD6VWF8_9ROSI|nr:hypothetical protein NC653_018168 [Populus alba x Populus x berolinensis]KAJ6990463.1 hypothetical protein NC653_018883 [Populus alba x Populus x berolinensis]KAJ6990466.1 hypothetical protein NC653_018886 [Populus alba x Populus x berolinensis]